MSYYDTEKMRQVREEEKLSLEIKEYLEKNG